MRWIVGITLVLILVFHTGGPVVCVKSSQRHLLLIMLKPTRRCFTLGIEVGGDWRLLLEEKKVQGRAEPIPGGAEDRPALCARLPGAGKGLRKNGTLAESAGRISEILGRTSLRPRRSGRQTHPQGYRPPGDATSLGRKIVGQPIDSAVATHSAGLAVSESRYS